jgi:hypothetical protein
VTSRAPYYLDALMDAAGAYWDFLDRNDLIGSLRTAKYESKLVHSSLTARQRALKYCCGTKALEVVGPQIER